MLILILLLFVADRPALVRALLGAALLVRVLVIALVALPLRRVIVLEVTVGPVLTGPLAVKLRGQEFEFTARIAAKGFRAT